MFFFCFFYIKCLTFIKMLKQIFVQYENCLLQFHLLQHMPHLSVVYCTLLYSFEQFYEYLLFFVLANTAYVHNILCTVEMSYRGYMKDRNTLSIPVHLIPTLTLTLEMRIEYEHMDYL